MKSDSSLSPSHHINPSTIGIRSAESQHTHTNYGWYRIEKRVERDKKTAYQHDR